MKLSEACALVRPAAPGHTTLGPSEDKYRAPLRGRTGRGVSG